MRWLMQRISADSSRYSTRKTRVIALIDTLIDITLMIFLAVTAFAIIRIRSLFVAIMLFSIFSLHSAGLFVVMDAADVAFTEAAVGAGISTVLMLVTMALTRTENEKVTGHHAPLPLIVVLIGIALAANFSGMGEDWWVGAAHLVDVPVSESPMAFFGSLYSPDWSTITDPAIIMAA